ncbi:MAG: asparaginase [Flavobacteriales bacterium]|nr:asparaginase [Flavobacteriales bacterium]MDW8432369.1 asparaginase [Flavobacteriales bacterium]
MKKARPHIALLYAGGTIGSERDVQSGALRPVDFSRLRTFLPELSTMAMRVSAYSVRNPKDSSEVTPEDWNELAGLVASLRESHDGCVILHGTDTMAYAASALSFMLEGLDRPLIFTGSQLPLNVRRSDGRENILNALELAALRKPDGSPVLSETAILFRNRLLRATRATKISTAHLDAFESPNFPDLAEVGVDFHFRSDCLWQSPVPEFRVHLIDPSVVVGYVTVIPGLRLAALENALRLPALRALVIETFGAGNMPDIPGLGATLQKARRQGIVLVNITSCKRGAVRQEMYQAGRRLAEAGVLSAADLTREACVAKLYYLLSRYHAPERVEALWSQNLRGELTPA